MSDEDFVGKEYDQKDILTEEFLHLRIEQYKLNLEIRQLIKRIHYLKKKYGSEQEEETNFKKKGKVFLKKFISNYSTVLKKDFNKLSDKEKKEIYKTGLLKIRFGLNLLKFQKLKDLNKTTQVDKYVQERKTTRPFYIRTQFSEEIQEDLKIFEKKLEDKWRIWDKEIEIDEDIFDEIEEAEEEEEELTKELLEEISPDPIYFIDDDIGDVYSNIEYFEKGYANDDENHVIDDEDNPEETKEKIEEEKYFAEKDREERLKDKKFNLIQLKKEQLNKIKNETDKLEKEIKEEEEKIKKNYADNLDDEIPF
jgi:hypothetical protein|tara:strand:+ start:394 stop:1320 length:927 start_codon:yes stop_codon:yes gene_type:complete